ncbi:MAG: DUF5309 family protein [Duncaniella sp.]|nr:DUF5309 family protein [Duncaniella sp.]
MSTIINSTPVTTEITRNNEPDLLRTHVDERITRIRPSSTPLDQISRMVGARRSGSMKVEYYSVDAKGVKTSVSESTSISSLTSDKTFVITVKDSDLISPTETVLFPEVAIEPNAKTPLVAYVDKVDDDEVTLRPVISEGSSSNTVTATIPEGTPVVRMGRAAGELDVQTAQFGILPSKQHNYCQIFKAQVEESMLQRLADKEVGWSFSDQEESAIVDMRLGMEKSFLFGNRSRIFSGAGSEVFLTGGIWYQAGQSFSYNPSDLKEAHLTEMLRQAFTKGGGSPRKVLLGGSGLISAISNIDRVRVVSDGDKQVVWGIDFDRIVTKFGTVYVILSEIFDQCGMPDNGIIIDPEYLTKYTHIPFSAERISFQKQGVRNTEAVVLTEASCLVLRYPDAHMRIVAE